MQNQAYGSEGTTVHAVSLPKLSVQWSDVQVVPEPVDKWQDVGNGHHNVLEAFYNSPERFAYTFQNYVFVTRMMQVTSLRLTCLTAVGADYKLSVTLSVCIAFVKAAAGCVPKM